MTRHLIPRVSIGRWGGAALTDDGTRHGDTVTGYSLAFQWLGLMVELCLARVTPPINR